MSLSEIFEEKKTHKLLTYIPTTHPLFCSNCWSRNRYFWNMVYIIGQKII